MTNKAAGHKNINDLNPEKKQWSHLIEFIIVEYRLMGSEAEVSNAHVEKTWIKSETKLWHKWSVGTSELVLAKCLKKGAKPLDAGLSPLLFWVEVACRALLRCACNGKHTCIKAGFLVVKRGEWLCEEQVLCGCVIASQEASLDTLHSFPWSCSHILLFHSKLFSPLGTVKVHLSTNMSRTSHCFLFKKNYTKIHSRFIRKERTTEKPFLINLLFELLFKCPYLFFQVLIFRLD